MAVNWKNYQLLLTDTDSKECEVTGRDMGGTATHQCPVSAMKENEQVVWKPRYGGYEAVTVTFLGTDDETIHLRLHSGFDFNKDLKPDEEWESGWYSFGTWSHYVKIKLQKIEEDDQKPFFVHTVTDEGVTSDYADAKEAYENR